MAKKPSTDAFLKIVINTLPHFIFWKDKDSVFLGCNETFAKSAGLDSSQQITGKTDYDLPWSQENSDAYRRDDLDVMHSRRAKLNIEEPQIFSDGKEMTLLTSKVPLIDSDGDVAGIVGVYLDITERKQMELELKKAKEAAESASQAKSEFLANMSHDIRTPLTGMIGLADEMVETELSLDQVKTYARELSTASNRLLNLLNEILDISRIEQGHFLAESMPFLPKKMIQDIIDLLLPSIKNKGLNFVFDCDEVLPLSLIGPRILLHRILLNMLSNAIKFTDQGSIRLIIKVLEREGQHILIRFQIQDTGIGMSQAQQKGIFDPFSRATSSYQGAYQGAGLGLHIVKQFIEAMDGTIEVESAENKGSTFTCVIPFRVTDLDIGLTLDSTERAPLPKQPPLALAGRVLLVEDDILAQKVALMKLKRVHEVVDVVDKGELALEYAKKNIYDLIYLDVGLSDLAGYEVAEKLRAWESAKGRAPTTVLALTAHVDEQYKQKCLDSGMNVVLYKPLTREVAEKMCDQYVRNIGSEALDGSGVAQSDVEAQERVIDLEQGVELLGSLDSVREILALLEKEIPETRAAIEKSYQARDWTGLKDAVHKLHGGVCYTGTPRLKEAAYELEQKLVKGDHSVEGLYQRLLAEIDAFLISYQAI